MTGGSWFDTIGLAVVGLICVAFIGRKLLATFAKKPSGGCSGCSKCGSVEAPK